MTGRAQDRASEPDQSPNYDTPPINIAPIADEIKRLARTIEAHQSDAKHSEVIKREERDLHAQEEMAKWARLMYFVTAVMTILTGVGVIFLGFTLYFTKQAAEHSASMVDAANKSVEEARKVTELAKASADISRQALIATDRAWVKIDAEPEADEWRDRLACPGVLAGAMYQLPSDRTMRFTYMPFSIRRKDLNRVGWDGSISVDPRDSLVVDEQGLAGQIS